MLYGLRTFAYVSLANLVFKPLLYVGSVALIAIVLLTQSGGNGSVELALGAILIALPLAYALSLIYTGVKFYNLRTEQAKDYARARR